MEKTDNKTPIAQIVFMGEEDSQYRDVESFRQFLCDGFDDADICFVAAHNYRTDHNEYDWTRWNFDEEGKGGKTASRVEDVEFFVTEHLGQDMYDDWEDDTVFIEKNQEFLRQRYLEQDESVFKHPVTGVFGAFPLDYDPETGVIANGTEYRPESPEVQKARTEFWIQEVLRQEFDPNQWITVALTFDRAHGYNDETLYEMVLVDNAWFKNIDDNLQDTSNCTALVKFDRFKNRVAQWSDEYSSREEHDKVFKERLDGWLKDYCSTYNNPEVWVVPVVIYMDEEGELSVEKEDAVTVGGSDKYEQLFMEWLGYEHRLRDLIPTAVFSVTAAHHGYCNTERYEASDIIRNMHKGRMTDEDLAAQTAALSSSIISCTEMGSEKYPDNENRMFSMNVVLPDGRHAVIETEITLPCSQNGYSVDCSTLEVQEVSFSATDMIDY